MLTCEVVLPALQLQSLTQSCESCRLAPNRTFRGRKHLTGFPVVTTLKQGGSSESDDLTIRSADLSVLVITHVT